MLMFDDWSALMGAALASVLIVGSIALSFNGPPPEVHHMHTVMHCMILGGGSFGPCAALFPDMVISL